MGIVGEPQSSLKWSITTQKTQNWETSEYTHADTTVIDYRFS